MNQEQDLQELIQELKGQEGVSNQVKEAVTDLEEAMDEGKKAPPEEMAPKMELIDLYLAYNHAFSPAVKRAFSNQVKSLRPVRNLAVITKISKSTATDQVLSFGLNVVGEENIVKGAMQLIDRINALALEGNMTGVLSKLSAVQLPTEPYQPDTYAIFSYISFTTEGAEIIQAGKIPELIEENGLPTLTIR